MADPEALSVSIIAFVRNPVVKRFHPIVSDTSPWRLCAALYHPDLAYRHARHTAMHAILLAMDENLFLFAHWSAPILSLIIIDPLVLYGFGSYTMQLSVLQQQQYREQEP